MTNKTCIVCQKPSQSVCSSCKVATYCSKDCQKSHWKVHKPTCTNSTNPPTPPAESPRTTFASYPSSAAREPHPQDWLPGLSPSGAAEWFVDCYRLRLDDDMVWGGGNLHGLYDPEATPKSIAADFLVFCKLAVAHKVVPSNFDWSLCLTKAQELLPYAFEKDDAREKYGGENIFSSLMGRRSLRMTGQWVYGSGHGDMSSGQKHEDVAREVEAEGAGLFEKAAMFADVGGSTMWKKLARDLKLVHVR
ncbi:hypothetical protein HK097_010386 [Rhizophlyctis rosea]|uniref:MYND-type domain-containing protein n=1 Tax=Rhizophlyctis rosea TaxID=64517 RepID=A0AAD5SFL4_9FUNG|nr:hypothetical protein HK097_010386 [Rhizophlyctis rosea]